MLNSDIIKKLMTISKPIQFRADEFICYSGEQNRCMYIILKGQVAMFVNSVMDNNMEATRLQPGDFFGELTIFEDIPSNATCVALEETLCIAVTNDLITELITICPEIGTKIITRLSTRIRTLDHVLYKTQADVAPAEDFFIPPEYSESCSYPEPPQNMAYLRSFNSKCPVCEKNIVLLNMKTNILVISSVDVNMRIRYKDIDPLRHNIWSCPYCGYSNHYKQFFKVMPFMRESVSEYLKKQQETVRQRTELTSPFDALFLKYIEAIQINKLISPTDDMLTSNLWSCLYWLFCDTNNKEMTVYCAEQLILSLNKVFEQSDKYKLSDDDTQRLYMIMAAALNTCGKRSEAMAYYSRSLKFPDISVKKLAYKAIGDISDTNSRNRKSRI